MPTPTDRNRLDEEESPYLQAHADNPVNWQPWDEQALQTAREHDVPIFLSIGYSSCHWCHVMAEESFEDETIAKTLNEHFVPIKLDREERPDIDSIYMTVCQLVNRAGCGWPLSVWLTPDGKPFYIGTYFPKESSRGQPGFGSLLDEIRSDWVENREDIESRGRQWMQAAKGQLESTPVGTDAELGSDILETAVRDLVSQADREYGGFGGGQKFPQPSRLQLLALAAHRTDVPDAEAVLEETLDAMADGGLRDHLGGGFHRYCVDRDWTVPHFEKMLYDNAGIPKIFLAGWQLTGADRYREIAEETFAFIDEEMTHEEGAFFSSLDARSPPIDGDESGPGRGVEGAYYVWTPGQVHSAIRTDEGKAEGPDSTLLADLVMNRYGITSEGNFEGRTVPTLSASISELAAAFELDESTTREFLSVAEVRLRDARSERPRPPRDEKILAGWNGMMIDALAEGSIVLETEGYAERAQKALSFLEDTLWDGEQLARRYKATGAGDADSTGAVKGDGVLEDYAFLAKGALSVYEATGSVDGLSFALDLARTMRTEFWDADRETLFYTPTSGEKLPIRPQEVADQSTPSSMGVAVEVLLALDAFAPAEGFGDIADGVLRTHAETIVENPMQHASLVRAAELQANGHLEITVAGDTFPGDWQSEIASAYLPDRLIARRPAGDEAISRWLDRLDIESTPAIWEGREATDGPTAYVCRNACSPPIDDTDGLSEWIAEFRL